MQFLDYAIAITFLTGSIWISAAALLFLGLGRIRKPSGTGKPRISVLVAARNEEHHIGNCLKALSNQDYPTDLWETIVIDDDSTDQTRIVAAEFADSIPGFTVLSAGKPSAGIAPKKNALITGIANSTGDIILITDADCEPPPGWISGIARHFSPEIDAVVGFSVMNNTGFAGRISRLDSFVNGVVSAGSIGMNRPVTAAGRNFAYRRKAWEQAGGFGDTARGASGDDDLLLQRIASSGGGVDFACDSTTHVPARGPDKLADWLRMKRRHLSAGKRYQPGFIILSAAMYIFQIGLILLVTLAALQLLSWIWVVPIWGIKLLMDGMTLLRGARLLEVKGWFISFLAAEVVTPFLFAILVPLALSGQIRWKGRLLNR